MSPGLDSLLMPAPQRGFHPHSVSRPDTSAEDESFTTLLPPAPADELLYPAPVSAEPAPTQAPDGASPASSPEDFGKAFNAARQAGEKAFTWKGRQFTTQTAEDASPASSPEDFGKAFNAARQAGEKAFTWKGRQFTTQAQETRPAGPANLAEALRNGGYEVPTPAPLNVRPAIVQEAARMARRRTPAAPEAPNAPNGAMRTMEAIGQVYPVAETAANIATMGVALPVAGIAGLGAAAAQAMGADVDPAQTVHDVAGAMTYQPRTELGQHLTGAAMYPFEQLAKAGRAAGDATFEATGSPAAAAAVDTAINASPIAIGPAARALRREPAPPAPVHRPETIRLTERPARPGAELRAGNDTPPAPTPAPAQPGEPTIIRPRRPMSPEGAKLIDDQLTAVAENTELPDAARARITAVLEEAKNGPAAPVVDPRRADHGDFDGKPLRDMDVGQLTQLADSPDVSESARARLVAELEQRQAPADSQPIATDRTYTPAPRPKIYYRDGNGVMWGIPYDMRPGQSPKDIRPEFRQDWVRLSGRQFMSDPVWGPVEKAAPKLGDGEWDYATPSLESAPVPTAPASPRSGYPPILLPNSEVRALAQSGDAAAIAEAARRNLNVAPNPAAPHPLENHDSPYTSRPDESTLAADAGAMREPATRQLSDIRGQGNQGVPPVARLRDIPDGRRLSAPPEGILRASGRERPVQSGELRMDEHGRSDDPYSTGPQDRGERGAAAHAPGSEQGRDQLHPTGYPETAQRAPGTPAGEGARSVQGAAASDRGWSDAIPEKVGDRDRHTIEHDRAPIPGRDAAGEDFLSRPAAEESAGKAVPPGEDAYLRGGNNDHDRLGGAPGDADIHYLHSAPEGAARGTDPAPRQPAEFLAGRHVTEFETATLERLVRGNVLSAKAKDAVTRELSQRSTSEPIPQARPPAEAAADTPLSARPPSTLNGPPGAAYVPLINDTRLPASKATTAADLPAPMRREHILHDFAKAIGTTVYQGRINRGKMLGFFRPKNQEVRIKRSNDIEVAAHEVAHLIDARTPEIAQSWAMGAPKGDIYRAELRGVSYDKSKMKEGFAEFIRLRLTQPDEARARAPEYSKWFDAFEARHKYGPALKQAQADMTAWYGQDALQRARSKIGSDTPLRQAMDGMWDKFRQATVDDLHGVYLMERELTGGIGPRGPYESARLSRASASIADGAVRFGAPRVKPDGSFEFAGKGLEQALAPVADKLDDALLYFVGKSANELMQQGREHLFTQPEIDAMLRLRTPEREQAFADYQAWNKGVLDFAEYHGVLNPATRKLWQRVQYLPFQRVGQPGAYKAKPGDWSGIKALTGGTENIREVLPNMISNAAQLIDLAVKNDARHRIAALADNRKGGKFMVKIPAESRPVKIDKGALIDAVLKAMGLSRRDPQAQKIIATLGDMPGVLDLMQGNQPPAGNNVVAVLRGGRKEWYEVGDPVLMRALSSIDRPYQHWLINWLGLPKRVGQAAITLTPDFWVANLARDTIMGSIMSRAGFRIGLDSLNGMRLRMTSDPIYKDYIANGGGLSSIYLEERQFRAKLEKFYGRQGIDYRTVLDTPEKLLGFVETLGDAFEMSTRLGEYKRALDRGEHPRHAAYLGREVSTDFAMRGDSPSLGVMYDTVMFLKPAVLSWDRLARGLAHDPNRGAIAIKAGTLALASAALYLQNREDPRYDDLPDWDRDANWHFFVGDQHFRWPKIWEVGALASGAERMVEKTLAEDPEGLGKDFARILAHTFSVNLLPQIVAPLAEQSANRRFFTGTPIETQGMENEQPWMRAKPSTSETMKALGEATADLPEDIQIPPARAEALLRGYLNTWAGYGLMLSDAAFFGNQPEKRLDELPIVRRFYAQDPARHTKYEEAFFDMLKEATMMRGTIDRLHERGDTERATKLEAKHPDIAWEARYMQKVAKWNRDTERQMTEVRRDRSLTPAQKRVQLDTLTAERNQLFKETVLELKKQGGK